MAGSKRALGWIVIIALAGGLLIALNPTIDDFAAWRAASAQEPSASKGGSDVVRAFERGAKAIAGAMVGLASGAFERRSYLFFSTFGTGGSKGQLYLGIARAFVKLR
jgi:hypothetical protein